MPNFLKIINELKNDPAIKDLNLNFTNNRLLYDLVDEMAPFYSKKEILDSVKFTLDFFKKNKLIKLNFGDNDQFKLIRSNPINNLHVESVIEYHIKKEKILIATFGFYFTISEGKVTLRVSNIQGHINTEAKHSKHKILIKNKDHLDSLNKDINDNWRIKIVTFLSNYATLNKMNISIELPMYTGNNKSDYIRQLRQYIQTALKAGLSVENISSKRINDKVIKEKIISNLKIKKNRLLENKNLSFLIPKNTKDVFKKNTIRKK